MTINLPAKLRLAIYIAFGIGNLVSVYLINKAYIGVDEVTLYNSIGAFVFGLAGLNTPAK